MCIRDSLPPGPGSAAHRLTKRPATCRPARHPYNRGHDHRPRSHRPQPHRAAPHRHRPDRALQLPLRSARRRDVHPPPGGHGRGPLVGGVRGGHPRASPLARAGVGRGAGRLLAEDRAYPCYCTPDELDAERHRLEAARLPQRYSGRCATLTPAERASFEAQGRRPAIRFRIEPGIGVFVDDAAMGITHVIRGEDHLSNTPKHILLFRALGYPVPVFAHLPLILNPDRTKMSKRKSQTAMKDYIADGFVREALVNYLALLGWSTGTEEEILSLDELVARFDTDAIQKGGAIFDRQRLEWLNGQWIRRLADDDLAARLAPFLAAETAAGRIDRTPSPAEIVALLPMVRERLPVLGAIGELVGFLYVEDLVPDAGLLVPKRSPHP